MKQSWKGERVFINPPYSSSKEWVKKAYEENKADPYDTTVVLVLPARTDTKYWQDYILPYATRVLFIRGRIKLGNGTNKKNSAPFPSAIVVFGQPDSTWLEGITLPKEVRG